ncbi:hypothetical protein CSB45_04390 [candidate division KSB3 bacterium]|uniref:Sulfotransferase family protein n=1 Tax=candidate division KSB3 bacterium TaxID=2044937 RepID=A0A2G6E968_9BACT|nr:MAG: hypothetical protein CSB45_04390 [candidate division KSB3 bacterium]PIE30616.1 MAG: hypothetical protein CSA57_02975 [candidate division KSB3 bacterium]
MWEGLRPLVAKGYDLVYGRALKEKIFFLHIPKCGGKSCDAAIMKHYDPFSSVHITAAQSFQAAALMYELDDPIVKDFDSVLTFREHLLLYFMHRQGIRYITGHVSFSERAYQEFQKTYNFLTMIRDPVKRWISNFFFHRHKLQNRDYVGIEDDLATFLCSERGTLEGQRLVRMLGGVNSSHDYASQAAIEQAQKNLHKFAIIGCLEHLDLFLAQFRQRFGVSLRFPRKNQNPKTSEYIQTAVSKDMEEKITQICQPDIDVYNYAIQTFVKRGSLRWKT